MRNKHFYTSLFVALIAAACSSEIEEDIVTKERIGKIAEKVLVDSTAITFSLDSLTSYTWDEVYIITPYTQLDRVTQITRVDLSPIEKTGIESADWKNVIAFISKGKLISYVDLPRNKGVFTYLNDFVLHYPYGATTFRMINKNGRAVVEKIKN